MAEYNEIVSPLFCFGSIYFYSRFFDSDVLVDIHEHYVKQSLRNRFELCGANGPFFLTVPVRGQKGQKTPFKDIVLDHDTDWKHQHLQAIQTNYGSSPFFEHFFHLIEEHYRTDHTRLMEFNLDAHDAIVRMLGTREIGTSTELRFSEQYVTGTPGEDLRQKKRHLHANRSYIQVFSDRYSFNPHLSVLDALFCLGPETTRYLKNAYIS